MSSQGSGNAKLKRTRILSIDGGGIRGIIPGMVLIDLEKRLQKKTNDSALRLADCFEFVAGTSTGGILACGVLAPGTDDRPRLETTELVDLYLERGDEIFNIPLRHRIRTAGGTLDEKYPARELEEALNDVFGDLWLSELLKPCLITGYNIKRRETVFFTQHDAKKTDHRNFLVKDVARATSAAPTYFEVAKIRSKSRIPHPVIDGGVFANNPSLCAYAEARASLGVKTAADIRMLSLGTGIKSAQPIAYDEAKDWGLVGWVKPLLGIMMSSLAETVDYQIKQIFSTVEDEGGRYARINVPLQFADTEMDNASPKNIELLRETGIKCVEDNSDLLDSVVDWLLEDASG